MLVQPSQDGRRSANRVAFVPLFKFPAKRYHSCPGSCRVAGTHCQRGSRKEFAEPRSFNGFEAFAPQLGNRTEHFTSC